MTASTVLIGLGWFNAAAGVVVALVLLAHGAPLGFFFALLLGIAGAALPLTVGFLARTVVYRFALEDNLRKR